MEKLPSMSSFDKQKAVALADEFLCHVSYGRNRKSDTDGKDRGIIFSYVELPRSEQREACPTKYSSLDTLELNVIKMPGSVFVTICHDGGLFWNTLEKRRRAS